MFNAFDHTIIWFAVVLLAAAFMFPRHEKHSMSAEKTQVEKRPTPIRFVRQPKKSKLSFLILPLLSVGIYWFMNAIMSTIGFLIAVITQLL